MKFARIILALVWLGSAVAPAAAEKRVALVVGNAAYADAALIQPVADARALAAELRTRGFAVTLRENATRTQLADAVAEFGEKLGEGDTAFFFFAGYGIQAQGRNYLLPVDTRPTSEARVRLDALDLEAVLDQMAAARVRNGIVVLDASRESPFELRFRPVAAGLAQTNAPEGTLIAYAMAPGRVAADRPGPNGVYVRELLREIARPGATIEDVFKAVRVAVVRETGGARIPWEASSLTGDVVLVPGAAAAAPEPAVERERRDWDSVRGSGNPADFRAFVARHPDGVFAPVARARIAVLEAEAEARARVAPVPTPAPSADDESRRQFAAMRAPWSMRGVRGQFTANVPAGVFAPTGVFTYFAIDAGNIRISGTTATGDSGYRCGGIGFVREDRTIGPIEVECVAGSARRAVSFAGRLIEDAPRRVVGTLEVEGGRRIEVEFR